jgi:hypothetical protein
MKINDFISGIIGNKSSYNAIWGDQKLDKVNAILDGRDNASPLLATTTWQTLVASPDLSEKILPEMLKGATSSALNSDEVERYVLCLGNNQFCLLVFDPHLTTDEPIHIDASQYNSKASIQSGFENWQAKIAEAVKSEDRHVLRSPIPRLGRNLHGVKRFYSPPRSGQVQKAMLKAVDYPLISSGIQQAEWPIVICKPPKRVMNCFHPDSAHQVAWQEGDTSSLAGVYAYNKAGEFGATVCLHSFSGNGAASVGARVTINGLPGRISSTHNISDSCFVALDANEQQIQDLLDAKGPLQGTTPREFEACTFVNRQGEQTLTHVIGWSEDILYTRPFNQVKVLTNPITNPGDSGSALLDKDGNVLGFSFYRTEINAVKEFSAWIWADSVFQAHQLIF